MLEFFNILTACPAYIPSFIFFISTSNTSFNVDMLKAKRDISQQDIKIVDLPFLKSEWVKIPIKHLAVKRLITNNLYLFRTYHLASQ